MLEVFLINPDLMDDRTSDTSESAITINRDNFRKEVIEHDGTCVMTGSEARVQACHIVPHAKGHKVCSEHLLESYGVLIPGQVHHQSC
jgi:hypothetical protein